MGDLQPDSEFANFSSIIESAELRLKGASLLAGHLSCGAGLMNVLQ